MAPLATLAFWSTASVADGSTVETLLTALGGLRRYPLDGVY